MSSYPPALTDSLLKSFVRLLPSISSLLFPLLLCKLQSRSLFLFFSFFSPRLHVSFHSSVYALHVAHVKTRSTRRFPRTSLSGRGIFQDLSAVPLRSALRGPARIQRSIQKESRAERQRERQMKHGPRMMDAARYNLAECLRPCMRGAEP